MTLKVVFHNYNLQHFMKDLATLQKKVLQVKDSENINKEKNFQTELETSKKNKILERSVNNFQRLSSATKILT